MFRYCSGSRAYTHTRARARQEAQAFSALLRNLGGQTCTATPIYPPTHTHTHTYPHAHTRTPGTGTHAQIYTTCARSRTPTALARALLLKRASGRTRALAHTHTRTHTGTHTHTHTLDSLSTQAPSSKCWTAENGLGQRPAFAILGKNKTTKQQLLLRGPGVRRYVRKHPSGCQRIALTLFVGPSIKACGRPPCLL